MQELRQTDRYQEDGATTGILLSQVQGGSASPKRGVYFIAGGKFIKIGYSANIDARMATLATASPVELKFFSWIIDAEPEVESQLHQMFADARRLGEWFAVTEGLYRYLVTLWRPEPDDDEPLGVPLLKHQIALRSLSVTQTLDEEPWP